MIEDKIKKKTNELRRLVKNFKLSETIFKEKAYKLVKELIDLHRINNPDYSFCELLQERELMDYSDILEEYVPYDISPRVTDLYLSGRLGNRDLMVLANMNREVNKPHIINKLADEISKKKINSRELIRASNNEIRKIVGEEVNGLEEQQEILLQCIYNIESCANYIKKWNGKFKKLLDTKNKEKLRKCFEHLKDVLRDII